MAIIVFFNAVLEGMKGITYIQVVQYCVLIFAFMVPAFFISFPMNGNFYLISFPNWEWAVKLCYGW